MNFAIITILLTLLPITATAQAKRKPQLKRKLVEVVQCFKVPSAKPYHTGLNCGVNEKGEAEVLDIPETVCQFPEGEIFRMYVYSDGEEFPPNDQPKGSRVIITPPCPKNPQGYRIRAAQAPPCNPEN